MKRRIQNIVIPVDFTRSSERAARFGCIVARNVGARVHLVHVAPLPGRVQEPGAQYLRAPEALRAFAERVGESANVLTEVRRGEVADGIHDAAVERGVDLIVMAAHGRRSRSNRSLGSTAKQIVRCATCPVLVVGDCGNARLYRPSIVRDRAALMPPGSRGCGRTSR